MKILYLIGLLSLCTFASAQDVPTQTLEWSITSRLEVNTGIRLEESGSLITHTNQQIEWISTEGAVLQTYQVRSVTGHWFNVDGSGSITFHITTNEQDGLITLERTDKGLMGHIMMTGEEPVIYELILSTVKSL